MEAAALADVVVDREGGAALMGAVFRVGLVVPDPPEASAADAAKGDAIFNRSSIACAVSLAAERIVPRSSDMMRVKNFAVGLGVAPTRRILDDQQQQKQHCGVFLVILSLQTIQKTEDRFYLRNKSPILEIQ